MKLKNIPNMLSVLRIILVFVFVFCFFYFEEAYIALIVFLVAGLTDVIDGYLARRNNWITKLGKILDPFADKLMQCTVLICLLIEGLIPWWLVLPFFIKELFTLIVGFFVIKKRDVAVVSKWYGKLTVCIFYATIAASIIFAEFLSTHRLIAVIIFIPAALSAIIALVAYITHYSYLKNEEPKKGKLLNIRKEK
jgi:cardiolipin synthase